MTATRRVPAALLWCVLGAVGLTACGEDASSPEAESSSAPPVCADLDALSSSLDDLQSLELGEGALQGLQDGVAEMQSELDGLSDNAAEQYATEKSALDRAVDALGSSLDEAAGQPSASAWAAVADDLRSVGSAVSALGEAVGDTC